MLPEIPNSPETIAAMQEDGRLKRLRSEMMLAMVKYRYTYNFTWFDRPIIQLPDDVMAVQEIVLSTKPDLIIETGIAHGGSLMLSASMLELLGQGEVVGVDIEIRPHNRAAIESHPLFRRITLLEGSSTVDATAEQVRKLAAGKKKIMVCLDSMHTHDHVLRELELYSPLVTEGYYLIVFDTAIEDMPSEMFVDRPWGMGNNPKTAVREFLRSNDRFVVDTEIESRLMFSVAPEGYLRCVKD